MIKTNSAAVRSKNIREENVDDALSKHNIGKLADGALDVLESVLNELDRSADDRIHKLYSNDAISAQALIGIAGEKSAYRNIRNRLNALSLQGRTASHKVAQMMETKENAE